MFSFLSSSSYLRCVPYYWSRKKLVRENFGQTNFSPNFVVKKKISVQNKFDPRKIWFKKILVKRIMVKKEFAPNIFQSKNILVKEGICYEKKLFLKNRKIFVWGRGRGAWLAGKLKKGGS